MPSCSDPNCGNCGIVAHRRRNSRNRDRNTPQYIHGQLETIRRLKRHIPTATIENKNGVWWITTDTGFTSPMIVAHGSIGIKVQFDIPGRAWFRVSKRGLWLTEVLKAIKTSHTYYAAYIEKLSIKDKFEAIIGKSGTVQRIYTGVYKQDCADITTPRLLLSIDEAKRFAEFIASISKKEFA